VPNPDAPTGVTLENICNRTAAAILIPTHALRTKIGNRKEDISATMIQSLARQFHTSVAVMIDRVGAAEPANPFERCILLARRKQYDAEIRALYFGVGLWSSLPRPERYTALSQWLKDFPSSAIRSKEDATWNMTKMGRTVSFKKTELGRSEEFLLEATAS
jgi:hypothetical protein